MRILLFIRFCCCYYKNNYYIRRLFDIFRPFNYFDFILHKIYKKTKRERLEPEIVSLLFLIVQYIRFTILKPVMERG
jgi:hypothetical protein